MSYQQYFDRAFSAKSEMIDASEEKISAVLVDLASELIHSIPFILEENQKDLLRMEVSDPKYDRLLLSRERILEIAEGVRKVAGLSAKLGEVISEKSMPNGLHIVKRRASLGVVGVIYEARPNVTIDVFALCFKTGNVTILKGGSDALNSNIALVEVIKKVLKKHRLSEDLITLLPAEREATHALLQAHREVDVIIPRGSQNLINYVRENSRVPVIETGAGVVHVYADSSAKISVLKDIVFNAKTRRPSVCNSLDCLIIDADWLSRLSEVVEPLEQKSVVIYADESAYAALAGKYSNDLLKVASEAHFGTEFLSLQLAVKTVISIDEGLNHIAKYGSKHSEAIVSEDPINIAKFLNAVDAAVVYANASTAFTDGAQFGLGAEIGISTQKLHARGPMGLEELTTYKWVVKGNGQTRD